MLSACEMSSSEKNNAERDQCIHCMDAIQAVDKTEATMWNLEVKQVTDAWDNSF